MTNKVIETGNKPVTMEIMMASVDAILTKSSAKIEQDLAKSSERFEQNLAKSSERFEQDLAKSSERFERFEQGMLELRNSLAETDKLVKANAKIIGGMGNNNGAMAQEFFYNALFYTNTLFGQEFDEVFTAKRKVKKTGMEVEYDIILLNGQSVCIVEVKYKADTDDVRKLLNKEKPFRLIFPEYANKKLFLALASMSFDKYVEKACHEQGIAMIKQVGDTIEIYDDPLKVF